MENCTFRRILNIIKPFIDFSKNGHFEITQSNFLEITSVSESFGIVYLSGNSFGSFTDCAFTNNSALSSTVFKVESKSVLNCNQCNINSNFALKYGVFEVNSGGKISLTNSTLNSNFAVQSSLGSILETVDASEIANCTIYGNFNVANQVVAEEVQCDCNTLCMISQELKEYLSNHINEIQLTEASDYALSVITGSVELSLQTQVYTQSYLMNCFLSDVKVSETAFHSIEFTSVYISAILSNMTIENTTFRSVNTIEKGMILGISQSVLTITNVSYSESNSLFMLASSAEAYVKFLTFQNVTVTNNLLIINRSLRSELDNLRIIDCDILGNKVISLKKSNGLKILNIILSNFSKTLFEIKDSNVSLISNLHVSHYYRAIEAVNTNIELITNSSFSLSGASDLLYAGAVLLQNSNATLLNTTFTQNKAMAGAAIASLCSDSTDCHVAIKECAFENNSATVKGGAIYYDYRPPMVDTNTVFANNSAQYGRDFASYPVMVGIVQGNSSNEIVIDGVSSGIAIDQQISLALYDGNRQVMTLDNSSQINIMSQTQNASIKGINVKRVIQGAAKFISLIAVAEPGSSSVKYSISSKSIDKEKVSNAFGGSVTQPGITINFSYCKPGQQVIDGHCYECPAGTYSFVWNSTKCHQCEDNAACLGKQQMEIAKGYWRRSKNSTDIVECIQKEACEGGYHPENEHPVKCATEYTGRLCSKCAITESKKYQEVNDFECEACPNSVINLIRVSGAIFLVFAFFMIIIITNIRKTTESQFSVLLRILTNYLQIITTSMSMTTKFPSSLTSIFLPLSRIGNSSQTFLSFDCFISDYEIKGPFDSNPILKLFLMLLLPLILFCVVSLIWGVVIIIYKQWVKDIKRYLIISFTSILFILHPKLTESGINSFRCVTVDDTMKAARFDTNIECYSSTHLKWCILIALPILLVWVTMIPLLGLVVLYKARKAKNHKILGYFLILYQGLREDKFYWEFVNTLRKLLIVISFLFDNSYKIGLSLIIMVVSERIERRLNPYKTDENNKVALLSTVAGIITLNSSFVYEQDEGMGTLDSCILVFVIAINTKFILEWSYLCLKCLKSKSRIIEYAFEFLSKLLCKKQPVMDQDKEDAIIDHQILSNAGNYTCSKVLLKPEGKKGRRRFKRKRRDKKANKQNSVERKDYKEAKSRVQETTLLNLRSKSLSKVSSDCVKDFSAERIRGIKRKNQKNKARRIKESSDMVKVFKEPNE